MPTNTTLFTADKIIVGAGNIRVKNPGFQTTKLSDVNAAPAPTTTVFAVTPTTDAEKLRLGDIIQVNAQQVQVVGLNTSTGVVTVSPALSAPPVAGDDVFLLWKNLGATDGDIEFTGQITVTEQYVDQSPYPISSVITKGELGLNAPLADMDLRNLALALGLPETAISSSGGVDTLLIATPDTVREDEFLVTGLGPSGKLRTLRLFRGVTSSQVSAKLSKTNKQIVPLKVMSLLDSNQGGLGTIKDGSAFVYV